MNGGRSTLENGHGCKEHDIEEERPEEEGGEESQTSPRLFEEVFGKS